MKELHLTSQELQVIDEIVCGRYDALVELLVVPTVPNRTQLKADVDTLAPIVTKIRNAGLAE